MPVVVSGSPRRAEPPCCRPGFGTMRSAASPRCWRSPSSPLAVRRPHRGRLQPRQCRPHRLRERTRFGCALLQNAAQSDGDSEVAILPLMSAPARRQLWLIPLPGEQVLSAHVPRTRWSRPSTRSEPKSPSSGSRSDRGSARGSSGSWQSTTTKRGFPGPRQPLINDAIKNYSAFAAFKAEGINQPSL